VALRSVRIAEDPEVVASELSMITGAGLSRRYLHPDDPG